MENQNKDMFPKPDTSNPSERTLEAVNRGTIESRMAPNALRKQHAAEQITKALVDRQLGQSAEDDAKIADIEEHYNDIPTEAPDPAQPNEFGEPTPTERPYDRLVDAPAKPAQQLSGLTSPGGTSLRIASRVR